MSVITARRPIDDGLVLHLPLDEGAGTRVWDRSPYKNHGTVTLGAGGEAAFWANTYKGKKVATFDGLVDTVSIPSVLTITHDIPFSFGGWIYDPLPSPAKYMLIKYLDASNWVSIYFNSTHLNLQSKFGGTFVQYSSYDPPASTWHHMFYVHDPVATYGYHYVDGTLRNSTSIAGLTSTANTAAITLGRYSSNYCTGQLADLRMYNRAITKQEIRTLASQRRRF